jgi:hypothetical protein
MTKELTVNDQTIIVRFTVRMQLLVGCRDENFSREVPLSGPNDSHAPHVGIAEGTVFTVRPYFGTSWLYLALQLVEKSFKKSSHCASHAKFLRIDTSLSRRKTETPMNDPTCVHHTTEGKHPIGISSQYIF